MGDVSQLMPAIHPYVGGATGLGHGADYVVQDYDLAVITAAKALAATAIDLMADGAQKAGSIVAGHRPNMTSTEYLKFIRTTARQEPQFLLLLTCDTQVGKGEGLQAIFTDLGPALIATPVSSLAYSLQRNIDLANKSLFTFHGNKREVLFVGI